MHDRPNELTFDVVISKSFANFIGGAQDRGIFDGTEPKGASTDPTTASPNVRSVNSSSSCSGGLSTSTPSRIATLFNDGINDKSRAGLRFAEARRVASRGVASRGIIRRVKMRSFALHSLIRTALHRSVATRRGIA